MGAPVLFLCREEYLFWWQITTQHPHLLNKIPLHNLPNFFQQHSDEFAPHRIYQAKTIGRIDQQHQLKFVDMGLMPLVEQEMGTYLVNLMTRILDAFKKELGNSFKEVNFGQWIIQSAFWLLAAKILKDKRVPGFINLDLVDISEVFQKVKNHYKANTPPDHTSPKHKNAIDSAMIILAGSANLANLTIESLAYVYENAFTTKATRKSLGTHATPSYLVDYIVWQLSPWIENIPESERYVLEPACGHAPFLISAARFLRELLNESNAQERHKYLKEHLCGMDADKFALETARLSLTLADIPNPNGWQLNTEDIFEGNLLTQAAQKSSILFCNPPFQDFSPTEQKFYASKGVSLGCRNKAAEVLIRTLPFLKNQSVFGVILPRNFLHRKDIQPLRQQLIENFVLDTICELPSNVFSSANYPSVVIIGHKQKGKKGVGQTSLIRVRDNALNEFKECYKAKKEIIFQSRFLETSGFSFCVPALESVWRFCCNLRKLRQVAVIGQGLFYKGKDSLPKKAVTFAERKFSGGIQGFAHFDFHQKLHTLPPAVWMNLDPNVIDREVRGSQVNIPQILLNYARVSKGPWRLKALIDQKGYPVTSRFLVIRPTNKEWSLEVLWATLNSPFANAYAFTHSMERDNLTGMVSQLPLPDYNYQDFKKLEHLVQSYFELYTYSENALRPEVNISEAEHRMLAIDAEIMRLYNLPPKLERQVLDLFAGEDRRGVDFKFTHYYPEELESFIPLHIYLSEEYQKSTASFMDDWVKSNRSKETVSAIKKAVDAFKEDSDAEELSD